MITAAISKEYKDFNIMDVSRAEEFLQKIVQVISSIGAHKAIGKVQQAPYLQFTCGHLCFLCNNRNMALLSMLLIGYVLLQVEIALPHPSGLELKQYLADMRVQLVVGGGEQLQQQQQQHGKRLQADASTAGHDQSSEIQPTGMSSRNGASSAAAGTAGVAGTTSTGGTVRITAAAVQQRRRRQQELMGEKGYTPAENKALTQITQKGLLSQASPREVKRLLNQYRLSKHIAQQVGKGTLSHLLSTG